MTRAFKPYPFTARRYAASLPPLQNGTDHQRHRAVIVGGGPVGLCTALGLARQGVPCVLVEADDSVCFGSRAICISRRSLEIIDRLGALPAFLATGLPWTGGRSFYRDTEVLHFQMPQDALQKLPPMLNLAQYQIEQNLLDAAQRMPGLIDIRWNTRVTGVQAADDGVTLSLACPAGDYALQADWVVASDGGRSLLREALGMTLQGTTYEGRYVIVDILMDCRRPTERLAYFDPPSNPGSTVLVHKQPDNVWRIDYQLQPHEDPEQAIRPENVIPRVESLLAQMGETSDWSPIWIGLYKANALTLERYRNGRVLFAGDAAHLVPIFGVRGANSGIDDADNLAWKLAWVIRGLAGETLLDSYSDERVYAAHENLSYGTKSTEFMAPPTFAYELMRRAVLGLAHDHPPLRSLINPRQSSAIAYAQSPLNIADGGQPFAAGPAPGTVLPECPLRIRRQGSESDGHLTDLLDGSMTVLCFTGQPLPPALADDIAQMRECDWPVNTVLLGHAGPPPGPAPQDAATPQAGAAAIAWDPQQRLYPLFGAQEGTVYLLRPDGHVLARWHQPQAGALRAATRLMVTGQ